MKTNLINVNKIFIDRLFRIPDYQRGYAWRERQLKDYWSDLRQLEEGRNHYVGVLTLDEVPEAVYKKWHDDLWIIESKSFAPYYVVDGQQRLTTSILLIQAILERFPDGEKINYFTKEEIRKRFIYDSRDEGISRSYIFGYEKDNPSYEFLKTAIFLEDSENNHRNEATIYTQNLAQAKAFFVEKLSELSAEEIESVYKKVTQHFLFNIYSMSEDIDVHVAFESMNNRGKPLSILELLKNRLIYLTTKFNSDEHEKNKLRHTINEAWKTIYHYLGRNKDKPLDDDVFLLNHFFNYFGKDHIEDNEQIRYRAHYRQYKYSYRENLLEEYFTTKNINNSEGALTINGIREYVSSLKNAVGIWFDILNPQLADFSSDEAEVLGRIYRLERHAESEEFLALVLTLFEKTQGGCRS